LHPYAELVQQDVVLLYPDGGHAAFACTDAIVTTINGHHNTISDSRIAKYGSVGDKDWRDAGSPSDTNQMTPVVMYSSVTTNTARAAHAPIW